MKNAVTRRDNGATALLRRLAEKASTVSVGVHEEEGAASHGESEATIADIAMFHEYGLGVPQRSWLRGYVDEHASENRKKLRAIGEAVIKGTVPSTRVGLERFGAVIVGEIQRRIRDGIDPPLEQATIDAKGSSTPLIDTGTFWTSIRHRLNDG